MKERITILIFMILFFSGFPAMAADSSFTNPPSTPPGDVNVTVLALPQNYIITDGELIEDFESGFWAGEDGIREDDTVNYKTGTKSQKLTVTVAGSSGYLEIEYFPTKDLSSDKVFDFWMYLHSEPSAVQSLAVYTTSYGSFGTGHFYKDFGPFIKGWNHLCVSRNEWINTNDSWQNPVRSIRFQLKARAGNVCSASFDCLKAGRDSLPRVLFTFDDGYASAYTEGLSYMHSKGLKGTFYLVPELIGRANYMTPEQINDAHDKGWALGNHTYDHTNLTSLTTLEDVKEKLQQCTDWLDGQGYTRASKHVAYPYTDYNHLVLTAMNDLGMETGRIGGGRYHLLPFGHNYLIHSNNITSTTTLAEVKKQVDTAIEGGSILVFMFHDLVESPDAGTEWAISDFRELVDYIAAREVECVTIDELFKELTAQDTVPALSSQPVLP